MKQRKTYASSTVSTASIKAAWTDGFRTEPILVQLAAKQESRRNRVLLHKQNKYQDR